MGRWTNEAMNQSLRHMTKSETTLQRILLAIAHTGEIAFRNLGGALGLSPSTLESRARWLARRGLVEIHAGHKSVGLNPRYGHVVGIDLGASHLHFALADFRGEIQADSAVTVRPEDGPQTMIAQIKQGIRQLTVEPPSRAATRAGLKPGATAKPRFGRLRAISIGVPSAVDTERGVVAWVNNLPGWTNIHLGRELAKTFRVPIFVENDANMAAIGEHWRGAARGVNNFVFVALGTGIGTGVFIDGKLYRGRTGSAGEVFRMNLEWQRWNEEFPDTGYFESYVAGLGIAAEGRKMLGAPQPSEAAGLRQERDAYFVFEAYRQGSSKAAEVLDKVFTILGVGMANVVAILDPDLIVFGGGIAKGAPERMLATVEKVVRRIHGAGTPRFELSSLGDKAQTYGAIFSALTLASEKIACRQR